MKSQQCRTIFFTAFEKQGRAQSHAGVQLAFEALRFSNGSEPCPAHRNSHYEMVIPFYGAYHCRVNSVVLEVQQGEALVVQPGDAHQKIKVPDQRYAQFHFMIQRTADRETIGTIFSKEIYPSAQVVTLKEFRTIELLQGYLEFAGRMDVSPFIPYAAAGVLQAVFWQALSELELKFFHPAFLAFPLRAAFVRQLVICFESARGDELRTAALAKRMRLAPDKLAAKCSLLLGLSLKEAFQLYRRRKVIV